MAINSLYDNALSLAVPYHTKKMTDAVTSNSPTLASFKKLGGVIVAGGGSKIIEPLRVSSSNPEIVTDPLGVNTTKRDNTISAADYEWVELFSPLIIPERELNELGNNAAGLDKYVEEKIGGVIADVGKLINDTLHGVAATPSQTVLGTLRGAINAKTFAYGLPANASDNWASTVDATGGVISSQKVLDMIALIAAKSGSRPNLIITTPELWSKLADLCQVSQTINTSGTNPASLGYGFASFYFYGAEVVADAACAEGLMYFINTKNVRVHINSEIKTTEVKLPQPIRYWRFTQFCQLTQNCRKANGILSGLTIAAA